MSGEELLGDGSDKKYNFSDAFSSEAFKKDAARAGIVLKGAYNVVKATPGAIWKGVKATGTFLHDNPVTQGALGFAANYGPVAALGTAAGAALGTYGLYKLGKKVFGGSSGGSSKKPKNYTEYLGKMFKEDPNKVTKNLSKYKLPSYGYPPSPTDHYLYPPGLPTAPPNRWQAYYKGYPYVHYFPDTINTAGSHLQEPVYSVKDFA